MADDAFKCDRNSNNADITHDESLLIEKIKNAKDILMDSRKAELIASFLYLKKNMGKSSNDDVANELLSKKPYLTENEIDQTLNQWKSLMIK